ncbi:MAG: LysR family transcriptional regulator [Pseudomonadota bacterium]
MMKNWDDLKFCLALSRHGTMSDAATVLGTNVATVSRRVHRLSDEMGKTLFVKQGNRWVVTEAGAELSVIAEQIQNRIGQSRLDDDDADAELNIRISCAVQIMQCGLVDGIVDFLREHPRARLRLELGKRSLALNECDIRMGFEAPNRGRVVRRLLTRMSMVPACRRSFLDRIEGWLNVIYLADHQGPSRALSDAFAGPPKVEIEGLNLTRLILRANPLVAALPRSIVDAEPDLVEYPIAQSIEPLPVWLSYHEARRNDPAVRLAVAFLKRSMDLEAGHPGAEELVS